MSQSVQYKIMNTSDHLTRFHLTGPSDRRHVKKFPILSFIWQYQYTSLFWTQNKMSYCLEYLQMNFTFNTTLNQSEDNWMSGSTVYRCEHDILNQYTHTENGHPCSKVSTTIVGESKWYVATSIDDVTYIHTWTNKKHDTLHKTKKCHITWYIYRLPSHICQCATLSQIECKVLLSIDVGMTYSYIKHSFILRTDSFSNVPKVPLREIPEKIEFEVLQIKS